MKFLRTFSIVAALVVSASIARAQASAYGAVIIDSFGFNGNNYASGGSYKGATGGLIAGGFYTFHSPSRFKAGLDGRILYSPGYNGGGAYTGALRVGFVPQHNPLRPYFQLGGGVVSTQLRNVACSSCGVTTGRVTSGVAQLDFGLDIRVTEHYDIRFDYGADAGGSNGSTTAAVGWLGTGVVYHFHPTQHT
jgi:hypothetical protein